MENESGSSGGEDMSGVPSVPAVVEGVLVVVPAVVVIVDGPVGKSNI